MQNVSQPSFPKLLREAVKAWWQDEVRTHGAGHTSILLASHLWEFLRDCTPERRRSRYGDMEYDWNHRVNTTSGGVGWRERLLGVFLSAYQPTDPAAFQEMMDALPIDFRDYTFIDLGSGKGRTLLMASEYPFRRIVGVELIPHLHQIALENLSLYQRASQQCFALEAVCGDARDFPFPEDPLVLYLFNPLPESGLRVVARRLEESLIAHPRPVYLLYHNAVLDNVVRESGMLTRVTGTPQFSVYASLRGAG